MRTSFTFQVIDAQAFKAGLLEWGRQFQKFCVLDSNNWNGNQNELIAAVGSLDEINPHKNSFEELKKFHFETNDWLFGHLSYDLKNETENLSSENFDGLNFPQMHFFRPEYIFRMTSLSPPEGGKDAEWFVEISFLPELSSEEEVKNIFKAITTAQLPLTIKHSARGETSQSEQPLAIKSRIQKLEYIGTVNKIKDHIGRGDIYEMNYCMEFFSEKAEIDPVGVFQKLCEASQAPFSAFYRAGEHYLMCASPERFLKKTRDGIISQPIKGTAKRGENIAEDVRLRNSLRQSEKEKSENVMIVDLVRNDLSRSCDNVKVDELFGVYTFEQWHQMISTVSGELREGVDFTEVIRNSFPMGSMTGTPKVRAMELIEQYEKTKRGLYSGAVGYITPSLEERGPGGEVNFDFNVVIRSILYNQRNKYLSFQVGSAITANSVAEQEYEECLLKARGMFGALHPSPSELRSQSSPLARLSKGERVESQALKTPIC